MKRDQTSELIIEVGIQLHLEGLSLSNINLEPENFSIGLSRIAIHDWVNKPEFQPAIDVEPNDSAVDETWVRSTISATGYTCRRPDWNELLHIRLFHTTMAQLTHRISP